MKPPYYIHGGEIRDASGSPVIMSSELDALNEAWSAGFAKGRTRQEPSVPQPEKRNQIASEFFDESVRINQVIWLTAAICDPDSLPESLEEGFLEDMDVADFRRVFPDYQQHESEDEEEIDYPEPWEYAQWLLDNRKFGYLVAVQTPVREPGDTTFSWGYFSTKWIYLEHWNEEEVMRRALELKNAGGSTP